MAGTEQPKLGNTTRDIIVSLTKGGVGAVPCVGPLVAEVVGNVIPNQRVDRIVKFVRLLEQRLEKIEEGYLTGRFAQPEVVDFLEDGFTQASRATTHDRLEHLANVVASGISSEEAKQAEAKRMLWLLGQLDDAEIVILRSMLVMTSEDFERDSEFQQKHEDLLSPDDTTLDASEEEIESAALKDSYRQHLHDLGLVRHRFRKPRKGEFPELDPKTGMMKARGAAVTRLGLMLLHYLNLIPEWYRNE